MEHNNTSEQRSSLLRSPQERKQQLKHMLTRANSLKEVINDTTIQVLDSVMQETDNINSETSLDEKVHNQDEVLLDSEMMTVSSKVLSKYTRAFTRKMCSYSYVEFAKKQIEYVQQLSNSQSEALDWSVLGSQVTNCFKWTPHYSTLLGALDPLEKKPIKQRAPIVREAQAPIAKPKKVVTVEEEGGGVEQTVKVEKVIKERYKATRNPLDFFKLILHPTDFGKTVENMLHVSFLVRDGKVKISKDKSGQEGLNFHGIIADASGILVIRPCSKDMIAQAKTQKDANVQNVVYLDMRLWKNLNDAYHLEKPMLDFS